MSESMITTVDNPFNPITEFDEWYAYDLELGHNTCAYLARIIDTSDELSDADQEADIDQAINEILKYNINGMYKLVTMDVAS